MKSVDYRVNNDRKIFPGVEQNKPAEDGLLSSKQQEELE